MRAFSSCLLHLPAIDGEVERKRMRRVEKSWKKVAINGIWFGFVFRCEVWMRIESVHIFIDIELEGVLVNIGGLNST